MGSVRRQLMLFLATATPAMAEVCEKDRPNWSVADGPVSQWGEALHFLTSAPALLLLAAVVAGWVLRQSAALSGAVVVASVLMFPLLFPLNAETLAAAIREGCKGPPTIVIGLLAAICCVSIAGLILRRKGAA
jgi:hypothetical protein